MASAPGLILLNLLIGLRVSAHVVEARATGAIGPEEFDRIIPHAIDFGTGLVNSTNPDRVLVTMRMHDAGGGDPVLQQLAAARPSP
ncbi:MAG: hypothetical protein ACKV2Q_18845 [Planctomycetaceae bacterium]